MWSPMLKYRLRGLGEVARWSFFVPRSFCGQSLEQISVVSPSLLPCLPRFPSGGRGETTLPSAPVYELCLSSEGAMSLTSTTPSCHTIGSDVALDYLSRGQDPRDWWSVLVLTVRVSGGSNLLWRTMSLSGELIQCQSDRGDYVCSRGRIAMTDGDGTDSSTRVSATRHAWGACGYVLSFLTLNSLATEDLSSWVTCPILVTAECGYRGPRRVLSRGTRRS
jgi:hypothetical protein